ncbi:MAG: proline dehydrogenase family protein [Acidimicrobiia bacterium]|nr:proline dehydrogenase family protein [Acidimicrobiia bacterium]
MMRSAMLAVTNRTVTRKLITDTRAGKAVAHRFVAGNLLSEAVAVAAVLNQDGLKVSMDYLGEHVSTATEATAATESYIDCIEQIGANGLDANVSVKLTQLGMGFDDGVAAANLDRIALAALGVGTTVTVDMEESEHTEATISLYEDAQNAHGNLGIAIQSYLHRSPDDIERILPLGGHVRLCKGAYAEPASIAHQSSAAVDGAYDHLVSVLMANDDIQPAFATHDDARIEHVLRQANERSEPWEFQMLYGVRRDRQVELADMGHAMRVYVPYGEAWYPYLTRRMAERPANLVFFLRAVVGK